jgi:hypothetical protein
MKENGGNQYELKASIIMNWKNCLFKTALKPCYASHYAMYFSPNGGW